MNTLNVAFTRKNSSLSIQFVTSVWIYFTPTEAKILSWCWSNWSWSFIIIIAELSSVILTGSNHRLTKILSRSMASLCLEARSTTKDGVFAVPIKPLIKSMRVTLTVLITLVHSFKRFTFFVIFSLKLLKLSIITLELKQVRRTLKHEIQFFFTI